ncbi:hypothetical protein PG995_013340 [Apiospora arundinis]|uniref:Aspartic proteinase n=1 Tax=Apiospora arundinis TaxID=335852 RepID=A0ABR2I372_9PEZI
MKTSIRLVAVAIAALTTGAHAQLLFPFERQIPQPAQQQRRSALEDRDGALKYSNSNPEAATYVINVTVGTPPQNVPVGLVLSDSHSWIRDAAPCYRRYGGLSSKYYATEMEKCLLNTFKANESSTLVVEKASTYSYSNKTFSVTYLDGQKAYGVSVRDSMGLPGGVQVGNLTLGLASSGDGSSGRLSLGFNSTSSYSSPSTDPSFVDRLLAEGKINSKAFSMWLDNKEGTTGNLLLGAVDKSAFEAPLVRFNLQKSGYNNRGSYTTAKGFSAQVISFNTSDTSDGVLSPVKNQTVLPLVTIDPTLTVSTLPQDLAEKLWTMAGAAYDPAYLVATIPCSQRDSVKGRVGVQFSSNVGPNLTFPLSDLVLPMDTWSKRYYYNYDNDYYYDDDDYTSSKKAKDKAASTCLFGVQNATASRYSSDPDFTIGAPFLKRSYLVFDIASKEMAMAPVKFGATSTKDDVIPFPTYGANIPESTSSHCWESDTYYSSSYNCSYHKNSRGGGSGSSGGDNDYGLSGSTIGMIVGMVIFILAMLGVAIWGIVTCVRDNRRLRSGDASMYTAQTKNAMDQEKGAAASVAAPAPAHLPPSNGAADTATPGAAPVLPSIPESSQPAHPPRVS